MKWIVFLFLSQLSLLIHAQNIEPDFFELKIISIDGEEKTLGKLPSGSFGPRLSHDQEKVAVTIYEENSADVWVFPLDAINQVIVFSHESGDFNEYPVWSLDDENIFYISDFENEQSLYSRNSDGLGQSELMAVPARAPESWSKPGELLSYITLHEGDYAIWTIHAVTKETGSLISREGSLQHSSVFSPDGKWLAYTSDETGQFEVWVEPVPLTGERHQLTNNGGGHPLWSPDGQRLYYGINNRLYYQEVNTTNEIVFGDIIETSVSGFYQPAPVRRQFEIMNDGQSFLILEAGNN